MKKGADGTMEENAALRCHAPHVGEHEDLKHVYCSRKRKHKGNHLAHDLVGDIIAEWVRETSTPPRARKGKLSRG